MEADFGLSYSFERRYSSDVAISAHSKNSQDGGQILSIMGPSGSGKTTILRCLAGLDRPHRGFIHFRDEVWFDSEKRICLSPQARKVGYVAQDYALFPHLTVFGNIQYGMKGLIHCEKRARAEQLLEFVKLQGLEDRYPSQLSGGQKQRVGLARAFAIQPRLLLLDEPLSSLDQANREVLQQELREMLTRLRVPTVLVTHDREEARVLSDQIVFLNDLK